MSHAAAPTRPPRRLTAAVLLTAAATLAVVGSTMRWFKPTISFHGKTVARSGPLGATHYGGIGVLAAAALVVAAAAVWAARARVGRRLAIVVVGCAVAALDALVVAWFLIDRVVFRNHHNSSAPSFQFLGTLKGFTTYRHVHLGYLLSLAAAVLAFGAGVLLLAATRASSAASSRASDAASSRASAPRHSDDWQDGGS